MATIQIKTSSPDHAIALIKDALAMETKLTRDSLRLTDDRIVVLGLQSPCKLSSFISPIVMMSTDNR